VELQVKTIDGESAESVGVADSIFAQNYNESLVHQVVTAYLAAGRAGTKAQKTRAQVRGGGKKPWKQKGSGRARAGTTRGPLWRGGGRAFAAVPRDYSQKVNRKMYRGALRSIVSELIRLDRLQIVENMDLSSPKTKVAAAVLERLGMEQALIVTHKVTEELFRAARNLPGVALVEAAALDPVLLVSFEHVVMTRAAVVELEEVLS
jgi:large subunit ribosomal protein L4